MTNMLERLRDASNAHDPHRLASLFAEDYQSSQPLHPGRDFVGRAQVLQNWLSVFEGVPDFSSELVASAVNGETEWGESYWRGHHTDGSAFAMRGVAIFVVRDGLVVEGRLYMEPVEVGGGDIDVAVQELYKPRVRDAFKVAVQEPVWTSPEPVEVGAPEDAPEAHVEPTDEQCVDDLAKAIIKSFSGSGHGYDGVRDMCIGFGAAGMARW